MDEQLFYCAGQTEAIVHCVRLLKRTNLSFTEIPQNNVTHLLLDVPCKNTEQLSGLLDQLPADVTVIGGNLQVPILQNYKTVDLLQDPYYLAENANITAHCAVKLALSFLPVTLDHCSVLVIGWGRIGKCLAHLLRQIGADVSICARKNTDRAMITALGYNSLNSAECSIAKPRIVFNTVPSPVVDASVFSTDCLKIELASVPGITGSGVIDGRRLPGRFAPESSGELIAKTIGRVLSGGD